MARTLNHSNFLNIIEVIPVNDNNNKNEKQLSNIRNIRSNPMQSEKNYDNQEFTDSVNHCLDLLQQNKFITNVNNDVISRRSAMFGQEMYEYLKKFYFEKTTKTLNKTTQYEKQKEDKPREVALREDTNIQVNHVRSIKQEPLEIIDIRQELPCKINDSKPETVRTSRVRNKVSYFSGNDETDEDDDLDDDKTKLKRRIRKKYKYIPIEEKMRVVNLAKKNPTWPIEVLRKESNATNLYCMSQLKLWEKQVRKGGTIHDKMLYINNDTYDRCQMALSNNEIITREKISQWAKASSSQHGMNSANRFEVSSKWMSNFISSHKIDITGSMNTTVIPM